MRDLEKVIKEALELQDKKVSAQDIRRWFESKTKYKKQNDSEFYIRSAIKQFPQLKGKEQNLRKNIEKQKAKNKPWYPYMDAVRDTLKEVNAFEESINEALEEPIKIGQKVKLRNDENNRVGQVMGVNLLNDTVDVEFPEVQEKDLMARTDRFYTDEVIPVDENLQDTKLQELTERV